MSRTWWLAVAVVFIATPVVVLLAVWLAALIPWWGLVSGLVVVGLIIIWGAAIYDLFRRADVPLGHIPLWLAFILLLPVIGTLAYYLTRPSADKIRYRGEQVA